MWPYLTFRVFSAAKLSFLATSVNNVHKPGPG